MRNFAQKSLVVTLAVMLSACSLAHPPKPVLPDRDSVAPGQTIILDDKSKSIYAVAKANNVSMRDLIVLNNLQPPFLVHPGQKIILPASGSGFSGTPNFSNAGVASAPVSSVSSSSIEAEELPPPVAPIASPTSPTSKYVAKQTQVDVLNRPSYTPKTVATTINGSAANSGAIKSDTSDAMRNGYVPPSEQPVAVAPVVNPTATTTPAAILPPVAPVEKPAAAVVAPVTAPVAAAASSAKAELAKTDTSAQDADAPAPTFIWPVQGPVLSGFGPKGQGLNNDGVNIGAPKGSPVVASAGGIVVYAGNEMKGFGNLILVRHPGGWVTAYAHLDRVLVSKDAVVASGDMIGTVGKTGTATSSQVHFEIRHNSKPVDPTTLVKS